jgi:hypothetical protein
MTARLTGVFVVALVVSCVLPGAALAQRLPSGVQKVYNDFRTDGVVSPCKHSSAQLTETRRLIPPDIEQYAPEFPGALDAAIEARARGECGDKAPVAPVPSAPASRPPSSTAKPAPGVPTRTVVPEPPAPEENVQLASTDAGTAAERADAVARVAAATPSNDPPAAVWLLFLAAGLLAAAALFVFVAGRTRRGQESLAGLRHSWGEAAWRGGGTWADFRDFLRFGR